MKYAVIGYDQEILVKFNAKHTDKKLDLTDLLILDYIQEAQTRASLKHKTCNDQIYTEINREALLNDLPILDIGKDMLTKRLSKLLALELLAVKQISNETMRGSKSYYVLTSRAHALKWSEFELEELSDDEEYTTRRKKLRPVNGPDVKNYVRSSEKDVKSSEITRPDVKNYVSVINKSINTNNTNTTNTTKDNKINIKVKTNKSSSLIHSTPQQKRKEKQAIELAQIYNEICTNLSKVRVLDDIKIDAIAELLKQYSLDEFKEACEIANKTPFVLGDNDRGWTANFSFMIKPQKVKNILNGEYGSTSIKKFKKNSSIKDLACNRNVKSVRATPEEEKEAEKLIEELKRKGEKYEF